MKHRFYGVSKPFGMSMEEIIKNATVRGYFNSAQAIADYAEVILDIKKRLNAHYSPVIVFGGSYGGSKSTSLSFLLRSSFYFNCPWYKKNLTYFCSFRTYQRWIAFSHH